MRYIPELDGVRGIAMMMVMTLHLAGFLHNGPLVRTIAPFWGSVDVFFVLSGFLITQILLDTRRHPQYYGAFYARRLLRIFPIYWTSLAIVAVATPLFLDSAGVADFHRSQVWFWSYLYNWHVSRMRSLGQFDHLWSLSVEEQFYLVWPFVIAIVPSRWLKQTCLALIGLSFFFRLAITASHYRFLGYYGTPSRFEPIAYGALAAILLREGKLPKPTKFAFAGAGLMTVTWIAAGGFESNLRLVQCFGISAVALLSFAWIVYSLTTHSLVLNFPLFRWFGKYSYSMYIFHGSIYSALIPRGRWGVIAAPLLSCAAAYVSFELFEKRFLALKSYFPYIERSSCAAVQQTEALRQSTIGRP